MKTEILAKLFDKMKQSKGFPALKSTVDSVIASLQNMPDNDRDLVAPIVSDFALTQQVLLMANSAMYAPFAKNIPSVSKALQVIGSDALRHIVLRVPIVTSFSSIEAGLAQASLSSAVATQVAGHEHSETASISAMLYNLGTLVASRYLPDEMSLILNMEQESDLETAAKEVIGMTLHELGSCVAKEWRFPQPLVAAAAGNGDASLLKIAQFANQVAKLIYADQRHDLDAVIDSFDADPAIRARLASTIEDLIMAQPLRSIKIDADETALEELLWTLSDAPPSNPIDLANQLFDAVRSILEPSHCILAARTDSGTIEPQVVIGADAGRISKMFVVPAEFEPTAFGVVVKKSVDLALLNVATLRHGTLPEWYTKMVPDVKSLLIMPIANGAVVGMLIYGWSVKVKFTEREFDLLRKLRDLFVKFYPKPT